MKAAETKYLRRTEVVHDTITLCRKTLKFNCKFNLSMAKFKVMGEQQDYATFHMLYNVFNIEECVIFKLQIEFQK